MPVHAPRGERWILAGVLLVWAVLSVQAFAWLARCASPIPISDDMMFVLPLHPDFVGFREELWSPINEHRVPLVRLIVFGLMQLWRDIRGGMYLQVGLLSGAALGALLFVRRLRGRASPWDALFPLLWLHRGYAESWLLSLQLTVALPTVLVLAALALVLWRPGPISPPRLLGVCVCVLALGSCGGFGWCQMSPWVVWLGWIAWRSERATAWIAGVGAALGLVLLIAYPIGLPYRVHSDALEPAKTIAIALEFVSLCAGPAAALKPVPCLIAALILLVATLWGLARVLRTRAEQAERAAALLAGVLGVLGVGLGIGLSRLENWPVAGWASRYMGGATPLVLCAVLALVLYGSRRLATLAQAGLALGLLLVLPLNQEIGKYVGEDRVRLTNEFYAEVGRGAHLDELTERFWQRCFNGPVMYKVMLNMLLQLHLPPFEGPLAADPLRYDKDPLSCLALRPTRWSSPREPIYRRLKGQDCVAVQAEGELVFARAGDEQHFAATFGVLPWSWSEKTIAAQRTQGVSFRVALRAADGSEQVLWERTLDPLARPEDRTLQSVELELPRGAPSELVLGVRGRSGPASTSDWGAWAAVELR